MMAAVMASGTTIINNSACEAEFQILQIFNSMVQIEGPAHTA